MSTVQSPKHPKFISEEGADIYSRSKPDARFKTSVSERFECTPSVPLAGDFNSNPGD
ncbi:Carbon catabolite repressor protein 4-like 4, partial [Cucurbita argyrosperma subsp. argyrosperma]